MKRYLLDWEGSIEKMEGTSDVVITASFHGWRPLFLELSLLDFSISSKLTLAANGGTSRLSIIRNSGKFSEIEHMPSNRNEWRFSLCEDDLGQMIAVTLECAREPEAGSRVEHVDLQLASGAYVTYRLE